MNCLQQYNASRLGSTTLQARARTPLKVNARVAASRDASFDRTYNFNIHGRHVTVTPEMESHIKAKLTDSLSRLQGGEFLEAEGGIKEIDVKLMNSRAEIKLHPEQRNKQLHDTFLRQGELRAEETGADVYDSFNRTVEQLEKKWHKWSKTPVHKKDYRAAGGANGHPGTR